MLLVLSSKFPCEYATCTLLAPWKKTIRPICSKGRVSKRLQWTAGPA